MPTAAARSAPDVKAVPDEVSAIEEDDALAHLIPASVPHYKVERIVGDLLRAVALREAQDQRASE